ncbi:MAG: DUF2878 domain-containing protein [Phycisphaeraceae bacterium]|nr:DUF2878 domain-containing protein [Phycisphaeraceae bacterium]
MTGRMLNFVAFQITWFACVLSAGGGRPIVGVLVALGHLAVHFCMVPRRRPEFALVIPAMALGFIGDSVLAALSCIAFTGPARSGPGGAVGLTTVWMVMLWANFATTLRSSMRWLRGRPVLAAGFGAVGGPLAYWAGARLGAIDFPRGLPSAALGVGVLWLGATPLLGAVERVTGRCRPAGGPRG